MKTTIVKVLHQGKAVAGDLGYMLVGNDEVVCFYVDGWGDTGRIYPVCSSNSTYFPDTKELKEYPSITLEDAFEGDDQMFTEIYFPEFEGWYVFCANGGKVMSVCLRRRD